MNLHRCLRFAVAAAAALLAVSASAQGSVYRCTGAKGEVTFQQAPCDAAGNGAVPVAPVNVVEGEPAGEATLRAQAARRTAVDSATARGQVLVGMTEFEMLTVMGSAAVVNTDSAATGVRKEFVYRPDWGTRYVVVRDGLVSAVHDRPLPVAAAERRRCDTGAIADLRFRAGSITRSDEERRDLRRQAEALERRC